MDLVRGVERRPESSDFSTLFAKAVECRPQGVQVRLHEHKEVIDRRAITSRVRRARRPGSHPTIII